jgi:mannan endo-1,4-beta-mannosidase
MTNHHGINNLIWLWNGEHRDWYPGDAYVDIIGVDIYGGERIYASHAAKFAEAVSYSESGKIVVLSENGSVPDIELMIRDNAMWGFFATWSGDFVLLTSSLNRYSERYTERWLLEKVYSHERVVTLEDLPNLREYPIRD